MKKIVSVMNAMLVLLSGNATAADLSAAAKDLGLTEDEVGACQNPQ